MDTTTIANLKVGPQQSLNTEDAEKVMTIRKSLDGQLAVIKSRERRERIRSEFGLIYPLNVLAKHIKSTLPRKPFKSRGLHITAIHDYKSWMPDQALLNYKRATESKLFVAYSVIEPVYMEKVETYPDPWLVGWVNSAPFLNSNSETYGHGTEALVVLAYWD